jgi:hypothetical protein
LPNYRVPICDNISNGEPAVDVTWAAFALPKEHVVNDFLTDGAKFDPCHAYSVIDPDLGCVADNFDTDNVTTCASYVYDHTYFEEQQRSYKSFHSFPESIPFIAKS